MGWSLCKAAQRSAEELSRRVTWYPLWWMVTVYLTFPETAKSLFMAAAQCYQYSLPSNVQFSSVQSLSSVWFFATPWIAACQASLSITNSRSSLRLTSIESVMPSSNLILCHPLLLLPSSVPSIRVFSNESNLHMRWPKYGSFSLRISPSNDTQDWSPL